MQNVRESVENYDASVIPPTKSYPKSRKTVSVNGSNGGSNGFGTTESLAEISEEQEDELAVIQEIALSRVRNQAQVSLILLRPFGERCNYKLALSCRSSRPIL